MDSRNHLAKNDLEMESIVVVAVIGEVADSVVDAAQGCADTRFGHFPTKERNNPKLEDTTERVANQVLGRKWIDGLTSKNPTDVLSSWSFAFLVFENHSMMCRNRVEVDHVDATPLNDLPIVDHEKRFVG